jgi:hypothetical protein
MSTLHIFPDNKMIRFRTFMLTILLGISFALVVGLVKGFYYYSYLNKPQNSLESNYNNPPTEVQPNPIHFSKVQGHATVLK